MLRIKIFVVSLLLSSNLFAVYQNTETSLGNIAIEAGIWKTSLNGDIINTTNKVDFKEDLGFDNISNITSFGMDFKNDISWLPNIAIGYFKLSNTATSTLTTAKTIDGSNFSGLISTSVDYSELNTILYGYLQQNIFEFDMGVNIKKITYNQIIKENAGTNDKFTNDLSLTVPLAYVALKVDLNFIDTVLKAELSTLSIGDNEANSYAYSINYRVLQNMYISYGYRYNSWKATNSSNVHEKYNLNLKGNYFNLKVLF